MKKTTVIKLIESLEPLITGLATPKQRAAKLKEMLKEKLEDSKKYNLISGVQKRLDETFQENNKKELFEEIETAILLLEHFESSGEFSLVSLPNDKFSQDLSDNFNDINSKLKSIIE
jgi:hypothetical protein